jgi:hypothetical protein
VPFGYARECGVRKRASPLLEVDSIVFVNKFLRVLCVFAVIMGFMDEHCSMMWPR